ncbi:MAG: TraX family protein [Hominenteromicrobium sp.]
MENSIGFRKSGFQLTWEQLKWIAILSMLIDHVGKVLFPQIFFLEHLGMDLKSSYYFVKAMSALGRIAFPIFAYGIAQGCRAARSPKRYLLRLALFAVISEIPYNLALSAESVKFQYFAFHNVFFTLLLGALCCCIYSFFRSKGMAWVSFVPILCSVLLAELFEMDYGGFGVIFILAPCIFHKTKTARIVSLGLVAVVFYVFYAKFTGLGQYPFMWMDPQGRSFSQFWDLIGALAGVALLALYNGQKGTRYHKWTFYIIYPAHLLLLYLLTFVVPA